MANRLERGIDRAGIGTTIADPDVDFASLARGLGVWAEGPIDRPGDLAGSLERALAVVKTGKPALVDVITRSEEHTSELQSLMRIAYAGFCMKKKTYTQIQTQ